VPRWRKGSGLGWLTAEYAMLPGAAHPLGPRVGQGPPRRTHPGDQPADRPVAAGLHRPAALGENTIAIDCDVLQADGGTRTAAITGAYVALSDAVTYLGAAEADRPAAAVVRDRRGQRRRGRRPVASTCPTRRIRAPRST
jgi:ribonuclease PH